MCPGSLCRSVVDQLEQMRWHAHLVGTNRQAPRGKHGAGDDIHIPLGPHGIGTGVFFNFRPGAGILLWILRNYVGQAERLLHGRRIEHVGCRRHMPSGITGSLVIAEFSTFGLGQACIREKPIGAFLRMGLQQELAVQAFCNEGGSMCAAVV